MSEQQEKRILGIDFGSRRIGLALSDPSRTIATGYKTIQFNNAVYDEIAAIVDLKKVRLIVIGFPISLKGGESKKTEEVRRFAAELSKIVSVPIVFQDERFTSKDAMATMITMNTRQKQRRDKGRVDEMAAAIILQSFLNTMPKDNQGRVTQ